MLSLSLPQYPTYTTEEESTEKPFIVSNTVSMSLSEIEQKHIIPVFVKDNEPVISHQDLINATQEVVNYVFSNETILQPSIRVSHPIKGRIPEAKNKPASELLDHERTLYYERMAFIMEIPTISTDIYGNPLNLTVGGVKSYNLDNLNNRKGTEETFKVFIGFQNKVCCNLCVSTDGLLANLKVRSIKELMKKVFELFNRYNLERHIQTMQNLPNLSLSESQFASLLGRCKMYQHLPVADKRNLPNLMYGDNQLNIVAKDYYRDDSFCREFDGSVNLWKVFNLFTGANKQSYIDTFLDRGLNAFDFSRNLEYSLESGRTSWFLS